jgi:zinc protease
VEFGLPDSYWQSYAGTIRALTPEQVNKAARDYLRPDDLILVVVGDRKVIEPGLKALGFDTIQLVNADGELL